MDLLGTSSRRRPTWLKSLIVLLIGLAYLGGVYWASPRLREELRWASAWYGWPWKQPARVYYRVGSNLRLKGFEKRLVEAAANTQGVRMTLEVTRRWRVATVLEDDDLDERRTELSDLRECRYTATLVLDLFGSPDAFGSKERFELVVEGNDRWCVWVHDGTHGWHLLRDRWAGYTEELRRELGWGTMWPPDIGVHDPIIENKMVPLWPLFCPNAFDYLLRGTHVSREGEADFNGQRCRIVRIERRWEKSMPQVCRLWMPVGEDRVVKVEYTPAYRRDLVEALTEAELAELGTVCIVTNYEEPASFSADEFDPVPLLERWAADTARAVEEDIEQLEAWESGIGGGFGSESEGGFGEGFEDSFDQPDDDTPEDGQTE